MTTFTRPALAGTHGERVSLADIFGAVRRAVATKAHRRALRPLQDIDSWSDQAEVAFYEDLRPNRIG